MSAPEARQARLVSTRFLRSELRMVFGRRRNQVLLAGLAAIPIIIATVVRVNVDEQDGGGFFGSIVQNGLFVSLAALTVIIPLFLPLSIAVVSGDAIAGEASVGALRYVLTVPVHRTRLLAIKYATLVIFSLACTLLVGAVGAIIGLVLFPAGPVVLLSGTTIGTGEAALRILLVALYLGLCMAGLAAVGLFLSTLTEYPVAAMAGTAMFAVTSQVLSVIPQLEPLQPYLPTTYWLSFGDLLRDPVAFTEPGRGLLYSAVLIGVFGSMAWARFAAKDIAS